MRLKYRLAVWIVALMFYGIGDLVTTIYSISELGFVEQHPVAAVAIEDIGLWVLVPWKFAAIGMFFGVYRLVPNPHRIGVPIGLSMIGIVITGWNTSLVITALS